MPTLFRAAGSKSRDSMDQRRARAVRAATAVARAYGLDVRRPRVLADANNTIVHLRPAPVVAKVGTTWIRDGAGVLAQELSVAMHVASRSGPMPPPARGIPVEVHHHDGLAMTFWCYVKGSCDNPPAAVTAGSLRRLHSALADYPARLHSFRAELDELATALVDPARTPTLDRADRAFLRSTLGSLIAELDYQDGPVIVLHGDPHEGNRIATDGEVLWIDLEAACIGPVEWDLSALDEEDASLFDEADPEKLSLMRDLRSCRVAALCWMQPGRAPAVDEAARWHLDRLRSTRF